MIIDKKNILSEHQHMQSCTTFVMITLYSAIFSGGFTYCFDTVLQENNRSSVLGENDAEIWNRIIGKFFGKIGSALLQGMSGV